MRAGSDFGIKPFAVEAQRLLRLEKDPVIIAQDIDGMSHPGEISMGWAVNRAKLKLIDRCAIDILDAHPNVALCCTNSQISAAGKAMAHRSHVCSRLNF